MLPSPTTAKANFVESTRSLPALDLEALVQAHCAELEALFADASAPSLDALNGHPRGRMLAVAGLDGPVVGDALRALARSPLIVWQGKSFDAAPGAREGVGINRTWLSASRGVFPFRTYAAPSRVDGKPCIAIDYDLAINPRVARPTYDEVRGVAPGLYLGRGMHRRAAGQPRLLLWFALDARQQDAAVRFRAVR